MSEQVKSGRGGRRPGAGKPKGYRHVPAGQKVEQRMISLPAETWAFIDLFENGELESGNGSNSALKNLVARAAKMFPGGMTPAQARRASGRKTKDEERAAAIAFVLEAGKAEGVAAPSLIQALAYLSNLAYHEAQCGGELSRSETDALAWYREMSKAQKGKFIADLTSATT